jgi:putative intracellular protease/amidase
MAEENSEPEKDEDGLVIQRYQSRVLVVLPSEGAGDQILRYARSCLHAVHVGTDTVAPSSVITGRLQDEFTVDGALADAGVDDYAGILIAGCEGEHPLVQDENALRLVRHAAGEGKLIAAWGNGVIVLAQAGVLKGLKVTGDGAQDAVRAAGAKYTGRQVEILRKNKIVTALDESAGMRFGQALASVVRI